VLPSVVSVLAGGAELLFVGDDWAEDHHDVELVDETGRRLARARLPEGVEGIGRLHELTAAHTPQDAEPDRVVVGIETDRGPWVGALLAAGYQVDAINPMQVARYRERHATSGANSDAGDAHTLAELVRLDRAAHRPIAGDSDLAEATQAGRPRPPDPDLGPSSAAAAPAGRAAGVLPRRAGRLR
jgi:transposase